MKRILTLATVALLVSGAAFAGEGKNCGSKKSCCKKSKDCTKTEKTAEKETKKSS